MKFYVHSDDPVLTVVVMWDDKQIGQVKEIVDIFCKSLYQKYPLFDRAVTFSISNAKGKQLEPQKDICQTIQNKEDLFLKISPYKQALQNVCEKMDTLSVSQVKEENKSSNGNTKQEAKLFKVDKENNYDGKRNAAMVHMSNQRFRKALNIYKEIIAVDKTNLGAMKGLINCYLKAERFKDAVSYCKQALAKTQEDTEVLALASESYMKAGDGDEAIKHLSKLCQILRKTGVATAAEKQDVQVLFAKAYLVKNQKDMALTILQGVLRENIDHIDALTEYAALLYSVGTAEHKEEAVSSLLTSLVKKRDDKCIKQKFTEVMKTNDGMKTLKKVAPNVFTDVPALMFLAITVREFGAIEQTLEFFEIAYNMEPNSVCVLTYIHTLEVVERHSDALLHLLNFCKRFPSKGIGTLQLSDLIPHMDGSDFTTDISDDCKETDLKSDIPDCVYSDEDLYILALFFTVVKIFYIKGQLKKIPSLLHLLKPFCEGRELHQTLIRNEAAYFTCICEVFKEFKEIPAAVTQADERHIYFIGDSHCIPAAWQKTSYKGTEYTLYPILSTGTKIWHLRPESNFYPKMNFHSVIKHIPDGAVVTTCLGEIDCREAFLQCWEKAKYDTIEEAMEVVVGIYIQLLKDLQNKHSWTIFVHPVLPVLDLTRPIVMQFNRILATRLLREVTLKWLNFVNDLLSVDKASLKEEFKLDGTHMHPRYLRLFTAALNQQD